MYSNQRVTVPDPRGYVALRSVLPVSSSSVGEPETRTGSENVTLTRIVSPDRYVPVRFGDETDTTWGGRPSTARAPAPGASRPSEPGSGRVRTAVRPLGPSAVIEPPLRARADGDV